MPKAPMSIHFINLDRTPDRCCEFLAINKHLSHVSRFATIDGNDLDPNALVLDRQDYLKRDSANLQQRSPIAFQSLAEGHRD